MANSTYIGMSSAIAAQRRLEVASHNLANANTVGFRQQRVVFQDFLVDTLDGSSAQKGFTAVTQTLVDRQAGVMEHTGNPLDLAIHGEGFFAVQGPQGVLLSRAGNFQVDVGGNLRDASGYPVLAGSPEQGFRPVLIRPEGGPVSVHADGSVEQDGTPLARIAVVNVDAAAVTPVGGAHLQAPPQALRLADASEVASGYLEGSNVNLVRGMVDLIEVNRDYHHATRMQSESRKLDAAILKVAT